MALANIPARLASNYRVCRVLMCASSINGLSLPVSVIPADLTLMTPLFRTILAAVAHSFARFRTFLLTPSIIYFQHVYERILPLRLCQSCTSAAHWLDALADPLRLDSRSEV